MLRYLARLDKAARDFGLLYVGIRVSRQASGFLSSPHSEAFRLSGMDGLDTYGGRISKALINDQDS